MKALGAHLIWAAVTIVSVVVAGVVTLSALGVDTRALVDVVILAALPVLGAYAANISGKVEQVRQQSNGQQTTMLNMIAQTHPAIADPAAQVPDTSEGPHPEEG